MRIIDVTEIQNVVKKITYEACIYANEDLKQSIIKAKKNEDSAIAKDVLSQLIENIDIAEKEQIPMCQDTGFTIIYLEIGQDVHIKGGNINEAINKAVSQAYIEGYLRKSIIKNPISNPENTKDNTPAIIHTEIVDGDKIKITVLPKGGGAENMSKLTMLKPADGINGIKDFVLDTVKQAGPNPCPPIIVGVGIGGTFDYVAYLAKKAITRPLGTRNSNSFISNFELELLEEINKLNIGPAGLGGITTALDVFVEEFPRHIASLPVAVNIQCHSARIKTAII